MVINYSNVGSFVLIPTFSADFIISPIVGPCDKFCKVYASVSECAVCNSATYVLNMIVPTVTTRNP